MTEYIAGLDFGEGEYTVMLVLNCDSLDTATLEIEVMIRHPDGDLRCCPPDSVSIYEVLHAHDMDISELLDELAEQDDRAEYARLKAKYDGT